jgi:hypothetical protein
MSTLISITPRVRRTTVAKPVWSGPSDVYILVVPETRRGGTMSINTIRTAAGATQRFVEVPCVPTPDALGINGCMV